MDPATEPAVLEWLKAHRRGLTEITLRRFFFETRPLIPDAPEPARLCLAGRYPNYDLAPPGRKESPET